MAGPQPRAMTSDPRVLLAFAAVASTLAGSAIYFGRSNEGAPGGYMRRVPRSHGAGRADPVHSSTSDQAQLTQAPEMLEHKAGLMRRVKPRAAGTPSNSQRAPGRPVHFLFMACVVVALTGFAHLVWGSSGSGPKALDAAPAQPKGKSAATGAVTRAVTRDPRILLAFVALAVTLAGCALYLAGPASGGGYMRRVPHHASIGPSADGHTQVAKASEPAHHWGALMRRVTPRAAGASEKSHQGSSDPAHVLFMFIVVAALTAFAHHVWGTPTKRQEADHPVVAAQTTALASNPRILFAFVALASTLAGCALYFASPGVPGGYMRHVQRRENVGDASINALVMPKALESPPPIHFLFAICVVAALIAFAHQVWGRMMTLQRSSTDHKAPKA